jgi:hypothetical protein
VDLVEGLAEEVMGYLREIKVDLDGEHMYSNYQKVTAYCVRLTEIHNEIALMEIQGLADPELKKFRTMVLDPTIERLEKVAAFESRKITAKGIEASLER